MNTTKRWLLCPTCKSKTRTMLRADTVLQNYPLFCPKCRQEVLINVCHYQMTFITEPDVIRRANTH